MLIISQVNSAPAPLPGLLTWLTGKTLIDLASEGEFAPIAIESMLQSLEPEKAKQLVLQQNSKLNTPLFIHIKSAKTINYRSVQLLLQHEKADQLNRMMNADGLGALQLAIKRKDQRLLQYLLEQGANPEGPRNVRWPFPLVTPLQLAFGYQSPQDLKAVKILLAYGANPKFVNSKGYSVLDLYRTNLENRQMLLFPLHYAAKEGDLMFLKKILKVGKINVNGLDNDGRTALELAKSALIEEYLASFGALRRFVHVVHPDGKVSVGKRLDV